MIHMTFRNANGQNDVTWWHPQKGEYKPEAETIQLKEVLQIDISELDRQFVKQNLGVPVALHRPYTRYQGDLAKFIWDNL